MKRGGGSDGPENVNQEKKEWRQIGAKRESAEVEKSVNWKYQEVEEHIESNWSKVMFRVWGMNIFRVRAMLGDNKFQDVSMEMGGWSREVIGNKYVEEINV